MLDRTLTDEQKRFYEGVKVALTYSVALTRSKWMKYVSWKKLRDFKEGMKNWYMIGTKHAEQVMDLVTSAEKSGKELDEDLGIFSFPHFRAY